MSSSKTLWLGTALWGWGVDESTACAILDVFAQEAEGFVDAAVNYPINKRPEQFGRANAILSDWLKCNPGSGLKVFCKVGAFDNSGSPEAHLERSSILCATELVKGKFHCGLWGIGVHWDNRDGLDEIGGTLEAMAELRAEGLEIGFCGVKWPEFYAIGAPELSSDWWIEVKENASTKKARLHYTPHFPDARYVAYGINMGGVKSDKAALSNSSLSLRDLSEPTIAANLREFVNSDHDIEPRPETLNELALLMAFAKPELSAVIIGPRTLEQLKDTLRYWSRLNDSEISDSARRTLSDLMSQ